MLLSDVLILKFFHQMFDKEFRHTNIWIRVSTEIKRSVVGNFYFKKTISIIIYYSLKLKVNCISGEKKQTNAW